MRCSTGKRGYSTPQRARRALEEQLKRPGRTKPLFQYRCPECRQFHLTHLRQDEREPDAQ